MEANQQRDAFEKLQIFFSTFDPMYRTRFFIFLVTLNTWINDRLLSPETKVLKCLWVNYSRVFADQIT